MAITDRFVVKGVSEEDSSQSRGARRVRLKIRVGGKGAMNVLRET